MTSSDGLLVLGGADVATALAGRESDVVDAVRCAYLAHEKGQSSLPHSLFLRFPGDDLNRIISLPAYLGDGFEMAGMKWIASFPGNRERGLERASAVMVINSMETGRPQALLEGSLISARRTAASAALAAASLLGGQAPNGIGIVGTGPINRETVRFLAAVLPRLGRFVVHDLDAVKARRFAAGLGALVGCEVEVELAASTPEVLERCSLVTFATTAVRPHVDDLSRCPAGAVILHTSLRDLTAETILAADNVVDDADHVCRAGTSIHLAAEAAGHRDFIRCSLARILAGDETPRVGDGRVTVFSPFGLGVLDLAVARLVLDAAHERSLGRFIPGFLDTTFT